MAASDSVCDTAVCGRRRPEKDVAATGKFSHHESARMIGWATTRYSIKYLNTWNL
jgi:hypothetical protein